MWICLAFFWHCSQAQVFQPLPSLQLLVPFHLPGNAAAGKTIKNWGCQQDCVISQKFNWSCKQPELDLFIYWIFRWFLQISFFRGQKSKQLITLIGWAIVSSTHSKTVLSVIGKTKPTKPKQVKPSQTFGYTSVFLSGIAGASSTWRGHLSASATGSEEMDDYDVFTKTCMKLGPRYLPRRTKNTEQARRPANHAKLATSVDFKGTPFVDAKMVQKQQF